MVSKSTKHVCDDGSGDDFCSQVGKEDGIKEGKKAWGQALKSFHMQWPLEKDEHVRETKEEKPERLSEETDVWSLRQEKGGVPGGGVVSSAECNQEDKLTGKCHLASDIGVIADLVEATWGRGGVIWRS